MLPSRESSFGPTVRVALETLGIFLLVGTLAVLLVLLDGHREEYSILADCTSWRLPPEVKTEIESVAAALSTEDHRLRIELEDAPGEVWLQACGPPESRSEVGRSLRAGGWWTGGELRLEPGWKVALDRLLQDPTAWHTAGRLWPLGLLMLAPLVLLVAGVGLRRYRELPPWGSGGVSWGRRVLWVVGIAAAGIVISSLLVRLGLATEQAWVEHLAQGTVNARFLLIVVAILLAPVAEEVFFRGYVFRHLRQEGGQLAAYLVSSGLFGAFHGFAGGVPAYFAYGLLLAWGYDRTRHLAVPVLAHVLINTVAVALLVLDS